METQVANGVSAKFGYYPAVCNITTERFSVYTLSSLNRDVNIIENDPNIHNDWIYPNVALQHEIGSGQVRTLPFTTRIFSLPKTHVLTLHESQNKADLDFVVWCISFFTGMRLTITEADYLDATPIKQGKLVDFIFSCCALEEVINLALDYLKTEHNNFRATKRVIAAIHALFLSQFPQSLPFERFQYIYMALDTCFKLIATKSNPRKRLNHAERVQWMCKNFDMPVPSWAITVEGTSDISLVRNDTIHEALFFDEPLGFSIYGGNQSARDSANIILQMQNMVCRLYSSNFGKTQCYLCSN
ncbi:hypothetical protein [Acinetobacter sp.]|uniref:hypothetical protein n=1 Tax=Acinetobacter sp. TaxID=472 RepID=UPI0035B02F75